MMRKKKQYCYAVILVYTIYWCTSLVQYYTIGRTSEISNRSSSFVGRNDEDYVTEDECAFSAQQPSGSNLTLRHQSSKSKDAQQMLALMEEIKNCPHKVKTEHVNSEDNVLCGTHDTIQEYSQGLHYLPNTTCILVQEKMKGNFQLISDIWMFKYVNNLRLLYKSLPRNVKIACLPSLYIAGFAKCGSTDIYNKLQHHPQILPGLVKEVNFWTKGAQYQQYWEDSTGHTKFNIFAYVKSYQHSLAKFFADVKLARKFYLMDGTQHLSAHKEELSKLQHLIPSAKLIIMIRDPVQRLFSFYRYRGQLYRNHVYQNQTPQGFDEYICKYRVRCDYYNDTVSNLLQTFPRENVLFLKFEEYVADPASTIENKVIPFLNIEPFTQQQRTELLNFDIANPSKIKQYSMLNKTKLKLQKYYRPCNHNLADMLNDKKWTWGY